MPKVFYCVIFWSLTTIQKILFKLQRAFKSRGTSYNLKYSAKHEWLGNDIFWNWLVQFRSDWLTFLTQAHSKNKVSHIPVSGAISDKTSNIKQTNVNWIQTAPSKKGIASKSFSHIQENKLHEIFNCFLSLYSINIDMFNNVMRFIHF